LNKQELINKLQDIEWEDFEVKEAKFEVPKSSWETVSAFSNTSGGWLIFGVKKLGKQYEILGVSNPEKISEDFLNVLRAKNKFNKIIFVKSKKYTFDNKVILAFYVPQKSLNEKPIYYDNQSNTFIRTGSGDRKATKEEIDSFYRNASFGEKDQEVTDLTLEHLDTETIKQYRNYFAQINPAHRYLGLSDNEFLEKLGVLNKNKVTFAGLLVFGKDDSIIKKIPPYRLEYLEISGISYEDAPTRYDYRLSSESNLYQTFFLIYERLLKKIEVPFSIKQGVRDDDPPHLQALREALVNLIIHTDYFSKSNPRIRVFNNRFEFYNPGALPKKIELILKEDFSLPRNPIITKIFRYLKFSENIGSGFHKMINGWNIKYNFKPIIDGDFDFYKITFPTQKLSSKDIGTTPITTSITTPITNSNGINNELKILELLENNPYLTQKDIAGYLGLTPDGIKYHIVNLKKKNRIKRKGSNRKGSWEIINKR
jgi:ATP-dependent DNA helicase RecG